MKLTTILMAGALAACSGSAKPAQPEEPAKGEATAAAAAKAHPFTIGALEAFALVDGVIIMPNDGKTLWTQDAAEIGELMKAAGEPVNPVYLPVQPLLVKANGHVVLFDTGAAGGLPNTGLLPESLALAGVAPGEVTDIFISHAHSDHVGGLTDPQGALRFPAATIHMSSPEWASLQADQDANGKALVAAITSKVVAFEPGAQVLPEVKAIATPGHTPGHSSYEISSGSERLFYIGDVAHHSVISVQRPAWSIQFDGDKPAAEAMRQATLAKLAADHARAYGVHFPFPGLGHVATQGDGLVWQPE